MNNFKRSFKIPNRSQLLMLMNVDLNTIAPVGSALYTIDQLVNNLDTSEIEKQYDLDSEKGKEPIHPKTIIKVSLYALYNCRFSLRKMEEDTQMHLGYRWITGDESIDHSTIGKFLVRSKIEIVELFSQIVSICVEKDLIDFDVLAIDSVKIRANASYKQFRTLEGIEKEQNKIKNKISELLEKTLHEEKELQAAEKAALEKRLARLNEAKTILQERIEKKTFDKSESVKKQITEKEKINITDFDCKMIQQANGETTPGYPITNSNDTKRDVVSHFDLQDSDADSLLPAIKGSENNTGNKHDAVDADSGFSSIGNLEELERNEQKALIPDRRKEAEENQATSKGTYDRSNFKYDKKKDVYKCPQGELLGKTSDFELNGRVYNRYTNPHACKNCLNRKQCTKSDKRTISRDQNEEVKERMRKELDKKKNKKTYNMRAHCVESPYGVIKHNRKYRIVMRRGKEKVKMEIALLFMLHNILKIGS